jgi:hypothetical protein
MISVNVEDLHVPYIIGVTTTCEDGHNTGGRIGGSWKEYAPVELVIQISMTKEQWRGMLVFMDVVVAATLRRLND